MKVYLVYKQSEFDSYSENLYVCKTEKQAEDMCEKLNRDEKSNTYWHFYEEVEYID